MKNLLFTYFCLLSVHLVAQNINVRFARCTGCCNESQCDDSGPTTSFTYGGINDFTAPQVTSDFAARPLRSSPYDWHGGLDLSSGGEDTDKGDLLYPIETGRVVLLRPDVKGYFKYLAIQGDQGHYFGYGHLFSSTRIPPFEDAPTFHLRNGNVVMKRRSDNTDLFAIIFIGETPIRAIGISNGTVEWEGQTIPVTDRIDNLNLPIAAVGDSHSDDGDVPAHLHLFLFENASINTADGKTKNPLVVLTYPQPTYTSNTTIVTEYNDKPASIRVNLSMNGQTGAGEYSVVQDANIVGFRIRPKEGAEHPELIKGHTWGYISMGGKLVGAPGNAPYPPHIVKSGISNRGSITKTGINPFAYRVAPRDEYYYSDFYLRLHNDANPGNSSVNLAGINKNARFKDGEYTIMPSLNTIRPHGNSDYTLFSDASNARDIEIDNFWPYIDEVKVYMTGRNVYNSDYSVEKKCGSSPSCTGSRLVFKESTLQGQGASLAGLTTFIVEMVVHASEPIAGFSGKLWDPDGNEYLPTSIMSMDGNVGLYWKITFKSVLIYCNTPGPYQFEFYGKDYQNNQLLNFDIWGSSNIEEEIPYRASTSTWNPSSPLGSSGKSRMYKFINLCSCHPIFGGNLTSENTEKEFTPCDCEPIADFTYEAVTGGNTINFDAKNSTGKKPLTYSWDFGDGSSGSGLTDSRIYANGGQFIVVLKVTDVCGNTATTEQIVTVSDGNSPSLNVEIDGLGETMKNQDVTFNAIITGGTPPYKYCWEAISGGYVYLPNPPGTAHCALHKNQQDIKFTESTGIGTATVYVTVTDAKGKIADAFHRIRVREASIELNINHFPNEPSGKCGVAPFVANQYIQWVANVKPLTETPLPAEYTWDFGDGTPPVTEPYGQVPHSFTKDGAYTVKLTMCDLYGACITKSETYCVGNVPPPSNYKITPENTVQLTWGGNTQKVEMVRSSGSLCAPNNPNQCGPTIRWNVIWADCNYWAWENDQNPGKEFLVNNNGSDLCPQWEYADQSNIKPWGCLLVNAVDRDGSNNLCGTAQNNCVVYIKPSKPQLSNFIIEPSGDCDFTVKADVSGGGWRFANLTKIGSSQKLYKEYQWKAYNINNQQEEIEGFFTDSDKKIAKINLSHAYLNQFTEGNNVQVIVRLKVTDFANQIVESGDVLFFNPFKLNIKEQYTRCAEAWSYFEDDVLAQGGNGRYEYSWSVLHPVGSGLDFESGNPNDPKPYFLSPNTGYKKYQLTVKMKDANGNVLCQKQQTITVNVSQLSLSLQPQIFTCSNGLSDKKLGPVDLNGGSGKYGFEWTSSTPDGLNYISDVFSLTPTIHGVPSGQSITYTLTVGDLMSDCTATASTTVTSFANDLSINASTPVSICYGDGTKLLRAQGAPAPSGWNALPYRYKWTTNHRSHAGIENESGNTLLIPEMAAKYPGNYVYTVRYSNQLTGCYVEKDINLTIREQWKHTGYVPEVKSAVVGQEVDLWSRYVTNSITSSTPQKDNITVTWAPFAPSSITTITDLLPNNGKFVPNTTNNQLTMKVVDNATGCNKEYKSSRYILSYKKPEIFVTPHNFGICEGSKLCLDLKFDAHLSNYATSLLPDYVTVKVDVASDRQVSENKESHLVKLKLVNSAGLYTGEMCTTNGMTRDGTGSPGFAVYDVQVALQGTIWENIGDVISFIVHPSSSQRNITTCFGNAPDELRGFKMDFGVNCSTPGTHFRDNPGLDFRAGSYINIATPGKGIALVYTTNSHPHSNFNEGPSLEILPCISELPQAPELMPSENEETATRSGLDSPGFVLEPVGFEVVPNPFSQIAQITYVIPRQCYGDVEVNIRDFTGRLIKTIEKRQQMLPGTYQTSFDGSALPPGMYLYELSVCNGQRIVKKVEKINH